MNLSAAMGKLSYQTAIPPMSGMTANSIFFCLLFFSWKENAWVAYFQFVLRLALVCREVEWVGLNFHHVLDLQENETDV